MAYKARIAVIVNGFNAIVGSGQLTTATLALLNPKTGFAQQNGTSIIIFAPVDLVFEMEGANGYSLAGIAFKQLTPLPPPSGKNKAKKLIILGNGGVNMPKAKIVITEDLATGDTKIKATDEWINHARPPNQPRWKLVLMVQNDDGDVGIIDPEIENQD